MLAWLKKTLAGFACMGTWVAKRHVTGRPWLCSAVSWAAVDKLSGLNLDEIFDGFCSVK